MVLGRYHNLDRLGPWGKRPCLKGAESREGRRQHGKRMPLCAVMQNGEESRKLVSEGAVVRILRPEITALTRTSALPVSIWHGPAIQKGRY